MRTIDEQIAQNRAEYESAKMGRADRWVPACGGNELPFTKNGVQYLYVFNFATGKHGYLDMGRDIVVENI